MTTKKITLNAEKRKVIADQFQSFYEDKVKDKLIQAITFRFSALSVIFFV